MNLLAAWILFPAALLALCAGIGLLIDALTARRMPGVLVPVAGLAGIIVVGQFTTLADATAELTVPLLLILAVAGLALSRPWRRGPLDPAPAAVAIGVFLVFGAPVILSGEPTFAGFIKLDDTATWLALTDRIMEHGRSLDGLAPSTYQATLDFNLAAGYPIGVFLPFGAAQRLVGIDLAWVFQPYVAFLAAMLSLGLWEIVGNATRRPGLRALVVFIAAQPALLFGYALWGGVKEVGATVFIALAAALAPAVVRERAAAAPAGLAAAIREALPDVVPLALAAGALVGVLSMGGLVWLGPMLLALAVLAYRRFGTRPALILAGAFAALALLLVLPVISAGLVPPTSSPLTDPEAQGNLRGPLNAFQALGIWPTGDFRFDPDATVATVVLLALALAAGGAGLWSAWTGRRATLLLYASTLLAGAAIVLIGSPWAGGKALATASPVALCLALVGAAYLFGIDRPSGTALLAVLAAGVLWSNALAYSDVSLAPYEQLRELEEIGEDFAGEGPALMTEYNPNGARHFLRTLDGEGASELRTRFVPKREGGDVPKGYSADLDELDEAAILDYRTLVLRRSPVRSRPPLPYRLVWAGDYYEVWQRPVLPLGVAIRSHMALGDEADPAGVPVCSEVRGLRLLALANQLGAAPQDIRLVAAEAEPPLAVAGGRLTVTETDEYVAWLEGAAGGKVEFLLDGEVVASTRNQINNEGSFIRLGRIRIEPGTYSAELRFGGADLYPGSGADPMTGPPVYLTPADVEEPDTITVPLDRAEELCGRRWDWIEAISPAG